MNKQAKTRWPLLASLVVTVIATIIGWRATLGFQAFTWESYRRLSVARHPVPVPDVQLQDQDGRVFTPASYQGKLVLVNFIYTRCPSLCSYSGTVYARLLRALTHDQLGEQVSLLSISLDPDHDTPVHLREYRRRYTRAVSGVWRIARPLTTQAGVRLLARFGVISIPDGLGGIKHNAAVHLIDRYGRLVRVMDENDPEQILRTVAHYLAAETGNVRL